MHNQVLKDQEKIEETIRRLDDYKRDALKTCWQDVNKYATKCFFILIVICKLILTLYEAILAIFLLSFSQVISVNYNPQRDKISHKVSKSKWD